MTCYICGRPASERHHMLHGSANRRLAEEDGLTVMLCNTCHRLLHDKGLHDLELERIAERRWLATHPGSTIEDFIKRYGKNYL